MILNIAVKGKSVTRTVGWPVFRQLRTMSTEADDVLKARSQPGAEWVRYARYIIYCGGFCVLSGLLVALYVLPTRHPQVVWICTSSALAVTSGLLARFVLGGRRRRQSKDRGHISF